MATACFRSRRFATLTPEHTTNQLAQDSTCALPTWVPSLEVVLDAAGVITSTYSHRAGAGTVFRSSTRLSMFRFRDQMNLPLPKRDSMVV